MTADRRRHSKVQKLPPEVVAAVNRLLVDGFTYDQVVEFLNKQGHDVSRSSVGRYGQHFLQKLERLKLAREQAKAIVTEMDGTPATEMHEAANQLAVNLIMDTLMQIDDLQGAKVTELLKALAHLERSAVGRERLKAELHQKAQKVAKDVEERAAAAGLDPDTIRYIREQIYGLAS